MRAGLKAGIGRANIPLCSTGPTPARKSSISSPASPHFPRAYTSTSKTKNGENSSPPPPPPTDRNREKLAEREFFLSVLSTTATKRDAKSYLSRFKRSDSKPEPSITPKIQEAVKEVAGTENYNQWRLKGSGVNLGNLYGPPRAIGESPVFTYQPLQTETFRDETAEPLHVAVVKIRGVKDLDDNTLSGVGLTLAQLARLGLLSAVVVDCDEAQVPEEPGPITEQWSEVMEQCTRVANAIREHSREGARVVDQALVVSPVEREIPHVVHVRGGVEVRFKNMLLAPMRNGVITVVPPVAYTSSYAMRRVQPDNVMLALTREFAGLTSPKVQGSNPEEMIESINEATQSLESPTSLDRVIVLDPIGGIPASTRSDNSHIFVNLDQEYSEVRDELLSEDAKLSGSSQTQEPTKPSFLGASNPFTRFVESEIAPLVGATDSQSSQSESLSQPSRHIKNLDLIQRCLTLLPPSSSALLTTPYEAASSALESTFTERAATSVGTRRKRNPLIHNLLTDKPVISSSLPSARLVSATPHSAVSPLTPATFFKRGMPLTIIPDPRNSDGSLGWKPPGPDGTTLRLESDPRIDFPRLLNLIEDSFGRKLDVHHYLKRIKNRIAGIIIAGEYEGGAILTWEYPPTLEGESSPRPPVPYLDKFAVLRQSQGSGGVADIVFNAMVRSSFPEGVIWRSRVDNPVNKWYFERAVGTWKLPQGSRWCMFWTGEEMSDIEGETVETKEERRRRWNDYVAVCSGIEASWADTTKPPD